MKVLFIVFSIFIVFFSIITGLIFSPYHFYYTAITDGINGPFLSLKPKSSVFLISTPLKGGGPQEFIMEQRLWQNFPFRNFMVPMPIRHPEFNLVPHINHTKGKAYFGHKLVNNKNKEEGFFLIGQSFPFRYLLEKQRIFTLPFFKNHILSYKPDRVWEDLFTKNLRLPEKKGGIFQYGKKLLRINYKELVYNLFLLQLRNHLFPLETVTFSFSFKKKMGVLNLQEPETDFHRERFWLLKDNTIRTLILRTRIDSIQGKKLRSFYFRNVRYKNHNEGISNLIYKKFKSLPMEVRRGDAAVSYLYSSWSHKRDNKELLAALIRTLERKGINKRRLDSIYDYSFRNFGTTFSTEEQNLRETNAIKLERKIKEEVDKEMSDIQKAQIDSGDGRYLSEEEKVNSYLEEAKEGGVDSDDEDDSLTIE